MSNKAICPRGHVWDPSTLAGLPATETPRCPICGEAEPARMPNAIVRLRRWCRDNSHLAAMSLACFVLVVALAVTVIYSRLAAREAAEDARREAQEAAALRKAGQRGMPLNDAVQRQARQAEMDVAKWRHKHDEIKGELVRSEKARTDAVRQRNEQAHARKIAEDLAQTAEQVRQEAVSRRAEAARQLVEMHVAVGTRHMESGDLSASLLWFAEALRLAQQEKLPQETHRLRWAAVLSQCSRPMQVTVHEKKVNAVQLSPDGQRVLTAGADGAAVVWDANTGRRIGEPMQHMTAVSHASFSADGKRILTATTDMTVHVWDLGMGKETFPALHLMGPIVGLSFSPDSRRFLTVAYKSAMDMTEAELHVWDAATGEAAGEEALGSEISARPAAFGPDGKQVLTICQDRCARIWDIATEKQVGAAFSHTAAVVSASFRADGKRVLTAGEDGTARVWQANTAKPLTPPLRHGAPLRAARFSPDGHQVLTIGADRGVRVWDANTGDAVGHALRHPDAVSQALFSPDGRFVLTLCADGAARVWDHATGAEVLPALKHGKPIEYAAFTPVGDRILTFSGQVVRLWDLTAGEPPMPPPAHAEAELTVFGSNGRRVLRATETTVQVYDTEENRPVGVALPHKNKVSAAAFSADGRRVLTVSHQPNGDELEGQVRVWDTETGKPIGEPLVHPRSVLQAKFSADGRRVLTACQDRRARLWDADKSILVGEPMEHKEDLSQALFAPGGRHILTVEVEGAMRLWDAANAQAVGAIWGHQKAVNHLAFSPDGRRLVTASDDGTARVWEADTGRQLMETVGHGAAVIHAAFGPEGKRIVTVSSDRRARVWDAVTADPLTPPLRHRSAVTLGAFSADGRCLITVADDGVRVWDATTGEPISPLFKHHAEQPSIHGVTLGRDGRLVLNVGPPGDPSGRWTREFRADERPTADLLLMAELLGGQRLDGGGETAAFDDAELGKAWQRIQAKYGKDFAPVAERVAAWDRRGALECEQRQLWTGAVRHLDRLMAGGASSGLYARRAHANTELRHWQTARADYSKALESDAQRWDLWAGRAEVEAGLGRWEQAATDYSKAIERKGDRAELWAGRGRVEAERGDWIKTAADLGKAIHLGNREVSIWHQHSLALLAAGDEANYRRSCERLLQRFGGSKDETVARSVAWTCCLAEGAIRDLQPLVRRAEQAVTANPQSADDLRRLAVLLYRAGQFVAALTRLQEITRLSGQEAKARDFLLMAMTTHQLGRGDEAKKWLDKAEQIHRDRAKDDKGSWEDRLIYETLHREAEMLGKGGRR